MIPDARAEDVAGQAYESDTRKASIGKISHASRDWVMFQGDIAERIRYRWTIKLPRQVEYVAWSRAVRGWQLELFAGQEGEAAGFVSLFLHCPSDLRATPCSVELRVDDHTKAFDITFSRQCYNQGIAEFISRDDLRSKHLQADGSVVFEVTGHIQRHLLPELIKPQISDAVQLLFEDVQLSDIELRAEGQSLRAHRVILGLRSPVFKVLCYLGHSLT